MTYDSTSHAKKIIKTKLHSEREDFITLRELFEVNR